METRAFGAPDSPIAAVWVTGYETGDLIDASPAYFVRVTDSDHVGDVMMMNPTPFADRADAEAFVENPSRFRSILGRNVRSPFVTPIDCEILHGGPPKY